MSKISFDQIYFPIFFAIFPLFKEAGFNGAITFETLAFLNFLIFNPVYWLRALENCIFQKGPWKEIRGFLFFSGFGRNLGQSHTWAAWVFFTMRNKMHFLIFLCISWFFLCISSVLQCISVLFVCICSPFLCISWVCKCRTAADQVCSESLN